MPGGSRDRGYEDPMRTPLSFIVVVAALAVAFGSLAACSLPDLKDFAGAKGESTGGVAIQVTLAANLDSEVLAKIATIKLSAIPGSGSTLFKEVPGSALVAGKPVAETFGGLAAGTWTMKAAAIGAANKVLATDSKAVAVTPGATVSVSLTLAIPVDGVDVPQTVSFPKPATVSVEVAVKPAPAFTFKSVIVPGAHPRITTSTSGYLWVATQIPAAAHRIATDLSTVSASYDLPHLPSALAGDLAGNLYYSAIGGIFKLKPSSLGIATVSTTVSNSLTTDGSGNFYYSEDQFSNGKVVKLGQDGQPAGQFPPAEKPSSLVVNTGGIWAIVGSGPNVKVARWNFDGSAGPQVAIPCEPNCFRIPFMLASAPAGHVWVAMDNGKYAKISPAGQIVLTFDGMLNPSSMAGDGQGTLWMAGPYTIARFSPGGSKLAETATPVTAIGGVQLAIAEGGEVFMLAMVQSGNYLARIVPAI